MFISHLYPLVFIYLFSLTRGDSGTPCCTMNSCSMDKLGLVSQLMALSLEIQNTIKSNENCGNLEPSTTFLPTTTTEITTEPSTTIFTTEYTTEPSTTAESTTKAPERYWDTFTGGSSEAAIGVCETKGSTLLSIESPGEFNEVWSYLKSLDASWGTNNRKNYEHYWTSARKMGTPEVWTWRDGTVMDLTLVPGIIVPAGQEGSKNLILRYNPADMGQLTMLQWDGNATSHQGIGITGLNTVSSIKSLCENEPNYITTLLPIP